VMPRDVRGGDRWLLCSDGLTDYVPELDVVEILQRTADPREAAGAIVALALKAGTRDNVTAVVADVVDTIDDADAPVFYGSAARYFAEDVETA
jgi:PPM family protein phosphatase